MKFIPRNYIFPMTKGVYLLFDESKTRVLYIGASINIEKRVKQHYCIPWRYYSMMKEDNPKIRANLEVKMIQKYKPPFNRRLHTKCSGEEKYESIIPFNPNKSITPIKLEGNVSTQKTVMPHLKIKRRKERWKMEAQLKETYKEQFNTFSCRQIQGLLFTHYGLKVNHNTVNSDLVSEKYTPYLKFRVN